MLVVLPGRHPDVVQPVLDLLDRLVQLLAELGQPCHLGIEPRVLPPHIVESPLLDLEFAPETTEGLLVLLDLPPRRCHPLIQ